jgi:hypothetical protein
MGKPALDTEELLERLRTEHMLLWWEPLPPDTVKSEKRTDQARSPESLSYVNANWQLPDHFEPDPSRRGLKGRIVAAIGRISYSVLRPYFKAERDFLSHVVRINNALEARCDELTLRCDQLSHDMLARQAAEARNLTKLAVILHLVQPVAETGQAAAEPADAERGPESA